MADTNKQVLSFYRVSALPETGVVGGIYFNTTDYTISICTEATTFEPYAGKLTDASWDADKSQLTITKADGSSEVLDFSHVASKESLESLQGTVNGIDTRLGTAEGKITAIENALNGEGENAGLVAEVAANKAAIATLNGTADETGSVAAAVKAEADARNEAVKGVADRVAALETTIDTETTDLADRVEVLEGYFDGASGEGVASIVDAKINALGGKETGDGTYVDVEVTTAGGEVTAVTVTENFSAITDAIDAAEAAAEAAQGAADAVKTRVDKLYDGYIVVDGETIYDEGKSVRTIAAEEVAAIVDGANESYDTLKEIADWIAAHPEDAAEYNSRITALESKVDVDKVSTAIATAKEEVLDVIEENEKTTAAAYTELDGRVTTLESQVAALEGIDAADRLSALETAVDTTLPAAIATAKSDAISEAATATDNKIAALDLANKYEAKGTAADLLAAEKAEGGAIATNAAGVAANAAAIESLQTAVDNVMTWTTFN